MLAACALAETRWQCPEKVLPTKIEIDRTELGSWQETAGDMPLWLTNIAVYDGPVVENASLVPSEQKNKQDIWLFVGPNPLGKFIACEYGNGVVKLSQPLAKTVASCRVTTVKSKQRSGIDAEFFCQ